jgi:aspartate-semialdehyde dehydrogenase
MKKINVGILGATGVVGQMFVKLLENHPWFELTEVAASEKSSGKSYEEAIDGRWVVSSHVPEYARNLTVKACEPNLDCELVFSALDSSIALNTEKEFAKKGYAVSSKASSHRMDKDVPLIIPEVNPNHLDLIKAQQKSRGWKGFIVTDPNCSTIHMVLALKPLYDSFGIDKVMVTTMQSISGAGYTGVPSIDIIDNVIPYIKNEEDKLENEPLKLFGNMSGSGINPANIKISAQCNRVGVRYGHTESVSVKLSKHANEDEIINAFNNFNPLKGLGLPSAPAKPIIYNEKEGRPQPRLDLLEENGMASVVGRLRKCNILDYRFVVLGHNLVRGAAGAAILDAELLKTKGYIGQ